MKMKMNFHILVILRSGSIEGDDEAKLPNLFGLFHC